MYNLGIDLVDIEDQQLVYALFIFIYIIMLQHLAHELLFKFPHFSLEYFDLFPAIKGLPVIKFQA